MSLLVQNASTSSVHGTGRIFIQGINQDYDPTTNTTNTPVMLQLDGSQGVSENTARIGGTNRQVSWSARRGTAMTLTSVFNDPMSLQMQDGRGTLAFSAEGAGLMGTWGPFTSAAFTLAVVMRLDRTVTDYGTVPGMGGTLPLISSAHLSVYVPSGGAGEMPLDAMFLDRWRIMTVRNDATTRIVSVDGQKIANTTPSTGVVAVAESLVLAAAFPGEIAELIVWDGALTWADLDAFTMALGSKWNTIAMPSVPRYTIPQLGSGDTWPVGVPASTVWLDAAHPGSLFADTSASIPAVSHGRVALWHDRSGNGNHVTFSNTGQTYWATGGAEQINGQPVVAVSGATPGSFAGGNPLAGSVDGAFLMIAVWRLSETGGHPFSIDGQGNTFSSTAWVDSMATDSFRTMPTPASLSPFPVGARTTVVVAWERNAAGLVVVRVHNIGDTDSGGSILTESGNTDGAWLSKAVTIGSTGKGLQLAELMIWRGSASIPDSTARDHIRTYLTRRWGVSTLLSEVSGTSTTALPSAMPIGVVIRYLRLTRTVGNDYWAISALEAYKGSHSNVYFSTIKQQKYTFVCSVGLPVLVQCPMYTRKECFSGRPIGHR